MTNENETKEVIIKQVSILDFIPTTWKSGSVLITAYRVINIGDQVIDEENIVKDFSEIRVLWFAGTLSFPRYIEDFDFTEKSRQLKLSLKEDPATKEGAWIVFLQPYSEENGVQIRQTLSAFCGMYVAINGLANAYNLEYQHLVHSDGKITFTGKVILNPAILKDVNVSKEFFKFIHQLGDRIDSFEEIKKNRIKLALHWYEKSIRTSGTDAFLSNWIALEALAMPTTDIKSLKQKLGEVYNLDPSQVGVDFFINRLFGLRSDIVHNGLLYIINPLINDLLRFLFVDLLLYECQLPSIRWTGQFLNNDGKELAKIFLEISKK